VITSDHPSSQLVKSLHWNDTRTCGDAVLVLNSRIDLVAMDLNRRRSFDAEPYLAPFDSEDHHANIGSDGDAFTVSPGQDQHDRRPSPALFMGAFSAIAEERTANS
jgi:hypothetical protein